MWHSLVVDGQKPGVGGMCKWDKSDKWPKMENFSKNFWAERSETIKKGLPLCHCFAKMSQHTGNCCAMTIPKQSLIFDSDIIEPTEVGHTTTTCEICRQCRAKITFFAIDMNIIVMIFLYGSKYVLRRYIIPLKSYPKHFLRRYGWSGIGPKWDWFKDESMNQK